MPIDDRTYRELTHQIKPRKSGEGNIADFPETSGERERNKFRPAPGYKQLVAVAVVDADGDAIGTALMPDFEELARQVRLLRLALQMKGVAADLGDLDSEDI